MKTDFSKIFYDKYFSTDKRLIEVTLKNGKKISGVFISFTLGEKNRHDPYITRWHMVNEAHKMTLGIDPFGFIIGEMINQKDIQSITFLEDNTTMHFN